MLKTIFTESVWSTTFVTDLKEYCDFVRNNDTGRIISNNGGYQSNDCNLQEPVLQPLIQHISPKLRLPTRARLNPLFRAKGKNLPIRMSSP